MFNFVAKNKRLLQVVLVVLIVPPFAFWGIDSYQGMSSVGADVATVGDQRITESEFTTQLRTQQERMKSLLGRAVDTAAFDTPEARARILDSMIAQRLLTQEVIRRRMNVTDDGLRELIAATPAFQENGRFSGSRYADALKAEGYTRSQFENSVRRDLLVQQLASAVSEASILSRAVAREWALLAGERREVAQSLVPASSFAGQVKVTPEAIQAFYDGNRRLFEVPEQVRAEYVVLSADALLAAEPVKPEEVKAQYEARRDQYEQKEERRASHILVSVKPGASEADKAKARAKAQDLVAQLRKSPASFAELAKKHSGDPGSAGQGGDLGFFSRGMVEKPVEDAVFSMKANEIAGPVESEFGFHVLRLAEVRPGKLRALEEVRGEIEKDLRKQRAGRKFAEAAETFSNLVYEQPDSLKPAAEQFKLTVQDGGWLTRNQAKVQALNNPRLLSSLFSDEGIKNRRNTEAVEISPGTVVAARVAEHRPAVLRPLEEVRGEVIKRLTEKESAELAWKEGARKLEQIRKGENARVSFGAAKTFGREGDQSLAPEAVTTAFKLNRRALPAYAGIQRPDGYLIVRVSKVIAPEMDEAREKGAQAELSRDLGDKQFEAYLNALRADTKIEINRRALAKKGE